MLIILLLILSHVVGNPARSNKYSAVPGLQAAASLHSEQSCFTTCLLGTEQLPPQLFTWFCGCFCGVSNEKKKKFNHSRHCSSSFSWDFHVPSCGQPCSAFQSLPQLCCKTPFLLLPAQALEEPLTF